MEGDASDRAPGRSKGVKNGFESALRGGPAAHGFVKVAPQPFGTGEVERLRAAERRRGLEPLRPVLRGVERQLRQGVALGARRVAERGQIAAGERAPESQRGRQGFVKGREGEKTLGGGLFEGAPPTRHRRVGERQLLRVGIGQIEAAPRRKTEFRRYGHQKRGIQACTETTALNPWEESPFRKPNASEI
ncbi:MAG: hypothetical protein BWX70_01993 [Verrucomicrobia bacterium ADurb.Bin070]|nr:MAG: hypothetical protein BWX70_01993 [Verrucomicrobia bacterium ADurb.Bin070]